MKKIIALLLTIVMLAGLVSVSADSSRITRTGGQIGADRITRADSSPMGGEGWTILLYLCGTDLESEGEAGTGDLIEIQEAACSDKVRVVVQTGGTAEWQNEMVSAGKIERYVYEDENWYLVDTQPDADMGDPGTLSSFIRWGVQNYGAEHTALVLWNHGGGSISGVCFDETRDYSSLSLRDLDTALADAFPDMTDKFEFIGFDACLMATLETANILTPYARYMYASQETEPGTGWDYTSLLNYLAKHPDADGRELGKVQCDSYFAFCNADGTSSDATFSIIDLSKIDSLITAFDKAAKELYEADELSDAARSAISADNFGGNNRSEGYTNMIDLGDFMKNAASLAPSSQAVLSALNDAVICSVSGPQHKRAGGLSIYYPLKVSGSTELSTFRDICTSTYYLALVDKVAYGTTGQDVADYDNSYLIEDIFDLFSGWLSDYEDYEPDENIGSYSEDMEDCPLPVEAIFLDEDGIYTVYLEDTDLLAYGSCSLYMIIEDEDDYFYLYMGEDDDVLIDWDEGIITDNFDGSWVYLEDELAPIELIDQYEDVSVYGIEVFYNGENAYLRVEYNWDSGEFSVTGVWTGIGENGFAGRTEPLRNGDRIEVVYNYMDDYGNEDYFLSDPITVKGALSLGYDDLYAGEYLYSINMYDIYGGCWETDFITFGVEEDGSMYFYEE